MAELTPGEQLQTGTGTARVIAISPNRGSQEMFNLTVTDTHTYYVIAGTTPVLVHNASCGGLGDLAKMRSDLGLPPAGKNVPTLGRLDIGGRSFYGISGHGQPNDMFANAISKTHAEGDAFQQAKNAGITAKTATWYVDYPDGLCIPCGQNGGLASLAGELGIEEVTVVYPGGTFVVRP